MSKSTFKRKTAKKFPTKLLSCYRMNDSERPKKKFKKDSVIENVSILQIMLLGF